MTSFVLFLILLVPVVVLGVPFVLIPRLRMERGAKRVMAENPGAEQISIYLPLQSTFSPGKQREIGAKVAQMEKEGWTFLRQREANPLKTIRSWGGGIDLEFIRTPIS